MYFEIKDNRILLWLYVYPEGLIYDTTSGVSSSASSCCNAWESSKVFGLKSVFHLVSTQSDSANPLRSHFFTIMLRTPPVKVQGMGVKQSVNSRIYNWTFVEEKKVVPRQ